MRRAVLLLPQYVFMAWCLVKHRDNSIAFEALTLKANQQQFLTGKA